MRNLARVLALLFVVNLWISVNVSAAPYSDGTIDCTAAVDNQFVPSFGLVNANADAYSRYIEQYMYWDSNTRLEWLNGNSDSTFEPDAFFYNYDGTAYGNAPSGYWTSDLPSPYVDTQSFDSNNEKAVTIGSAQAFLIHAQTFYYSVTRMTSGGGSSSWLKLSAQRGKQWPIGWYGANYSYGCRQAANNVKTMPFNSPVGPTNRIFTAPGCARYWYNWQYYPSPFLYDC